MYTILNVIFAFLRLAITQVKTVPNLLQNLGQAGAMVPQGDLVPAIQAMANNAAPAFGNWSGTVVPNASAYTYPANTMVGGIIARFNPGAAFTDCTDTATNIVRAIPGAVVNQTFPLIIANLGSGAETLAAGTGVTLAGSTAIGSCQARLYMGQVTGATTLSLTGMFGWNLGTGGTLPIGL